MLSLITPCYELRLKHPKSQADYYMLLHSDKPDRDCMGYFDHLGQTSPPNTLNTPDTVISFAASLWAAMHAGIPQTRQPVNGSPRGSRRCTLH